LFFFASRRRHTSFSRDWSSDVCSSDLAESERAEDPRTVVLVKPNASGLRTNIVLITDRRTYLIEATAQSGSAYSAQIAWSYPRRSEERRVGKECSARWRREPQRGKVQG